MLLGLALPCTAHGIELSGLLDVRALHDNGERSWTLDGMGKTRWAGGAPVRLGQGIVAAEQELSDALSGFAVINASDDRRHLFDLQEAWVGWNPVPAGPWKVRARAGLFFPPLNQEIDYARLTWTPTRTLSASALNNWVGEELKTRGAELTLTHRGRATGSPHAIGFTAAIFNGNDPAGTLLAWRGWSVGDRISGASEAIQLADLPVYRADGAINKQTRDIHVFREIDGRAGFYVGVNYGYADTAEVTLLHYDNRGDPLVVKAGQYSWATRFDHAGLRLRTAGQWEWLCQYMAGETRMGAQAAGVDFRAWYGLASHRLGPGTLTVRYDRFATREHDNIASDPNSEQGSAVAFAYLYDVNSSLSVVSELLSVRSTRPARVLVGAAAYQAGNSVTTSLRWRF